MPAQKHTESMWFWVELPIWPDLLSFVKDDMKAIP